MTISAFGTTFHATGSVNNVPVATFTDTDTAKTASDFVATIDWGDGTTTQGTVSGSAGNFTVDGSSFYRHIGQYTITTTVTDNDSSASSTAAGAATIVSTQTSIWTFFEDEPTNNAFIGLFTDPNLNDQARVTIDWGDGTTTSGSAVPGGLTGEGQVFEIRGGPHTYADEDLFFITATVTFPDNSHIAVASAARVQDTDFLTLFPANLSGDSRLPLTNVQVATFTDANTVNVPSDFTASIDWGDGTTTQGTILGSAGHFIVDGTHTYGHGGPYTTSVTVRDNGVLETNAKATGKGIATINFLPPVFNFGSGDFDSDGDKNGDMLWQNPDGTIVTWDMNGAQIASETELGQVPANWHFAGIGHFDGPPAGVIGASNTNVLFRSDAGGVVMWQTANSHVTSDQFIGQVPDNWHIAGIDDLNGDGKSDVLWQSDAGAVLLWEMNGTQVTVNQIIGQGPGEVVTVGDVNGDGKADILFEDVSGHVVLWEMNGTQILLNQLVGQLPLNWHFAARGDFNGDGKTDLLFHSDAGGVVMWEISGAQIIVDRFIGQVPANWHISGTADVNADGKSDVIWTSDAGDHQVWEMSGPQVLADQPIGSNGVPASPPLQSHVSASAAAPVGSDAFADLYHLV